MSREGKRAGIDIIVPVYNALDDLRLCITSLRRHTDLQLDRLILIDDCSPDGRVLPFLREQKEDNILVLSNEENLGFSGTINRGITQSDRDVILLNSDTIVTSGWVDKIAWCAARSPGIATVTPFSNSATICSIPVFCQDNELPEGFDVDTYGALVERCSLHRYPTLSVAVGFCMFIKRAALEAVGKFDAETFQRGYGEENDFCWRASEKGYYHVLCDDTFVYHKGTISFCTEEKQKLIKAHESILKERYPRLVRANEVFCANDQNWDLRKNIGIYTKLQPHKKNILFALHVDFREDARDHVGGTQFHVKDLVEGLRSTCNVFVVARDGDNLCLTAYVEHERISFQFPIGPQTPYELRHNAQLSELLHQILTHFQIELVHVHHTQGLSLDIFYEAAALQIPLVATLHDYYYICPTIKLLDEKEQLCIGSETAARCAQCLKARCDIIDGAEYIRLWRSENAKALGLCDRLITPSTDARDIILSYYPELSAKLQVIEHGSNPVPQEQLEALNIHYTPHHHCFFERIPTGTEAIEVVAGWAYRDGVDSRKSKILIAVSDSTGKQQYFSARISHRADVADGNEQLVYAGFEVQLPLHLFAQGPLKLYSVIENSGSYTNDGNALVIENAQKITKSRLNVAFIGGMSTAKGSQMAYELIRHSSKDIQWFVFGGIGDRSLELLERKNLIKTNWYERDKVYELMVQHKIDLVCILPIWPETFCYTLSEAILSGVPVLTTDIGAVGSRTRALNCGWTVPLNMNYQGILEKIQNLARESPEYQEKKRVVQKIHLRTIAEMMVNYQTLYQTLISGDAIEREMYPGVMLSAYFNANQIGEVFELDRIQLAAKLHATEQALQEVQSSLGYKALLLVRKMPIPFKKEIKRILISTYRIFKRARPDR